MIRDRFLRDHSSRPECAIVDSRSCTIVVRDRYLSTPVAQERVYLSPLTLFNPCNLRTLRIAFLELSQFNRLRYSASSHNAEGSHNGSAAVLKTADRKVMQVRVLSPPPLLFNDYFG
jgi:hypothetical protein